MPIVRVTPKLETETAQLFELEGRRFAIVRVDPDIGMEALKEAHGIISSFLDMDVLILTFQADVEIVEVQAPTWHERIGGD